MRWLIAPLLVFVMLAIVPAATPAEAQSACVGGSFTTEDVAGLYVSQPNMMALAIEPCGGMVLTWDNVYGRHQARYQAVQRVSGEFIVAAGVRPEQMFGVYLDGQTAIGVSPAEPGWIKILTMSPYATDMRVYRLEKLR